MKRICIICARGGSKGLPGKNLRPLAGVPLIVHTIRHAQECGLFEAIGVSSDSEEILAVAAGAGVEELVHRPAELATDGASKLPALRHALLEIEARHQQHYDILVDISVTGPLRLPADIEAAIRLLETSDAANVITGTHASNPPYFSLVEARPDGTVGLSKPVDPPILCRQDAPPCFDMNGSIYVWWRNTFVQDCLLFYPSTRLLVMPQERSIDIDTPFDFELAAYLLKQRKQNLGK